MAYLRPSNIDASQAHPRRAEAVGPAAPRRLAGREDHDPRRQRVLPLAADALVRLARHRLRARAWPRTRSWSALARDEIERAERQFRRTGQPQRIFGSFSYAAGSWDRPRRVIVKAEHTAQGQNPRFVVANVPGDPQELYEDVYCQRGEMENRIKEQQLDLFADRTSCHRFLANQFRLLLSSAAYVLVQALRRTALAGTELARGAGGDDPAEVVQGGGAGGGDVRVGWCSTWRAVTRIRRCFGRCMRV